MKNTKKGFVIPLLIAIIALIAVGGGVYYHNKKKPETTTNSQTTSEQSPTITSATGSESLGVNEKGTWTVTASDPSSAWLSYSVTWGEAGTYAEDNIRIKSGRNQTATFVHTYTKTGVYPLVFNVINDRGQTAHSSVLQVSVTTQTKTSTPTPISTTIKLDAATKVAVVQAIMNGSDILASNDAVKIRNYILIGLQNYPKDEAMFQTMNDSQLLQIASDGLKNQGKPTADLATDPTATWEIKGNAVRVTHKSYAKPNSEYPGVVDLNVTYQAVLVNGKWY